MRMMSGIAMMIIGMTAGCDTFDDGLDGEEEDSQDWNREETDESGTGDGDISETPMRCHDPSRLLEILPGIFSAFCSSHPDDYTGQLRQLVLDTTTDTPAWSVLEHWPTDQETPGIRDWHTGWMAQFGYDPDQQIEHMELSAVAPTFYDRRTVYFHFYNGPGRFWASQNGKEPAMFAGLYRATASGEFPDQTWTLDGTPIYYSDDTTWERGGPRAVDAQVWDDTDGKMYMTFGSWDPVGRDVIVIADMDSATGRIAGFDPAEPAYYPEGGHPSLHTVATFGEAAYSLHDGDYYYLFINLGNCCSGLDSTYSIIVGRSSSLYGPYVDREGRAFNVAYPEDSYPGTVVASGVLGETRFIGPGHTGLIELDGEFCLSHHFYDGDDEGHPKLGTSPLAFDEEGWPYAVTDQTCRFQ